MTGTDLQEQKKHIQERIAEIEASFDYLQEETQAVAPSVSLGRLTRMEALICVPCSEKRIPPGR